MDFLSEKFALKSQPSKNSDFYMGAGGSLEHVMETLDNESFYSKTSASKCVQAFNPLQRAEHHVRLERTSPCQDNNGESSSQGYSPSWRCTGEGRDSPAQGDQRQPCSLRLWACEGLSGRSKITITVTILLL